MVKFKEPYYKLLLLSVLTGFLIPLICLIIRPAFYQLPNYKMVSMVLNTISSVFVAAANTLIVIAALRYKFLRCIPFLVTVLIVELISCAKIVSESWLIAQQFPTMKTFAVQWSIVYFCNIIAIPILYVVVAKLLKKFIQDEIILMLVTLIALIVVGQIFVLLQSIPLCAASSLRNIIFNYISYLHSNIASILLPFVYSMVTYFIYFFVRKSQIKSKA